MRTVILVYLGLRTYSLGTYNLGPPTWRYAYSNINAFGAGDLQSGNLQSRATDLESRNVLIEFVGGAGVMRTLISIYFQSGTNSLGI